MRGETREARVLVHAELSPRVRAAISILATVRSNFIIINYWETTNWSPGGPYGYGCWKGPRGVRCFGHRWAREARARSRLACSCCAWSSSSSCCSISCAARSERLLLAMSGPCCADTRRVRHCFICATGCTSVSLFESHRQAGGLRPKAGGGCVSAWIVCAAVRGADCRVQCFAAGRAIGGR